MLTHSYDNIYMYYKIELKLHLQALVTSITKVKFVMVDIFSFCQCHYRRSHRFTFWVSWFIVIVPFSPKLDERNERIETSSTMIVLTYFSNHLI